MKLKYIFLLLCFLSSSAFAESQILSNVHLVNPATQQITESHVVIEDGKIVKILPATSSLEGFPHEKIDLTSKFLIPGLVDMHVHAHGNFSTNQKNYEYLGIDGAAMRMSRAGVTAFLDLFNDEGIFFLRNQQRNRSNHTESRIFAAGPCLTAPGGHCSEYVIPTRIILTPQDAIAEVKEIAKSRPDVIKLVYDNAFPAPTLSKETMTAVIHAAQQLGIKTVVHIGTWKDVEEAALAGATAVTHTHWDPISDQVVQTLREKGTYVIPTMTIENDFLEIYSHPEFLNHPLLRYLVRSDILQSYKEIDPNNNQLHKFMIGFQQRHQTHLRANIQKMYQANVKLLIGTDIGNLGTFVGFSTHRELQLFAESGIPAWDILRMSSVSAGEFLGQKFGTCEGCIANLVALDANPVEDIRNTQKIFKVFQQ